MPFESGSYQKRIYLADSNRMLLGFGHTSFEESFRVLREIGYSDFMAFECMVSEPKMENLKKVFSI